MKKELYWILGTILLTLTIGVIIFGDKLFNGYLLDLQIHDTYYIFPKYFLLAAIFTFLLIVVYLNRLIYWKFTNRILNILTAVILLLLLVGLINYTNWISSYVEESGYYSLNKRTQTERIPEFTMALWILTIVIIATIVTTVTTVYKIARLKK